jgi:putative oligomerization/nucleic acid binding protein
MLGRRRPLARAAVVGGGAYALGKRRARREDEAAYDDAPGEKGAAGLTPEAMEELEKLGKLKDQGILTQAEFDEQKAKILDAS